MVMDEVVDDVRSLMECHRESAADVVNIKISKFGGLTKAKQASSRELGRNIFASGAVNGLNQVHKLHTHVTHSWSHMRSKSTSNVRF